MAISHASAPNRLWFVGWTILILASCGGSTPHDGITSPSSPVSPTISAVLPASEVAGDWNVILTIVGSAFVSSSYVRWNAGGRDTQFVNSNRLTATLLDSDIAAVGTAQISVVNADTGMTSNAVSFQIDAIRGQGDGDSFSSSVSWGGRFVAFESDSTNLVPGDTNGAFDIFLRDTCITAASGCTPSTIRVSVASDGTEANGPSRLLSITPDGRFVLFSSDATNLVIGDDNGVSDLFVRDTCFGAVPSCTPSTSRISLANDGAEANGPNWDGTISADGRFIAFSSEATNLVPNDSNGFRDVFRRDTCTGATVCTPSTTLVSVADDGSQGNAMSREASISADGRYIAFSSAATNFVVTPPGYVNGIFIRDTCSGAPLGCTPSTMLSSPQSELPAEFTAPFLSADARYVSYCSTPVPNQSSTKATLSDTCLGVNGDCSPHEVLSWDAIYCTDTKLGGDARYLAYTGWLGWPRDAILSVSLVDTCVGAGSECAPGILATFGKYDPLDHPGTGDAFAPAISPDGSYLSFSSDWNHFAEFDSNGKNDVFLVGVCPLNCTATIRISVASDSP